MKKTSSLLSLLQVLGNLGGDSVHVGLSLLGEGLTDAVWLSSVVLNGDLTDESSSLELLERVSDALSGGLSEMLGSGSVVLLLGVVRSELVDSDSSSHVELVSDRGSSNEKPVIIIRSEVLGLGGLVVGSPCWNLDLGSLLEVLSELLNEFLSWDVLDGDSVVGVEKSNLNLHTNMLDTHWSVYLHPSLNKGFV